MGKTTKTPPKKTTQRKHVRTSQPAAEAAAAAVIAADDAATAEQAAAEATANARQAAAEAEEAAQTAVSFSSEEETDTGARPAKAGIRIATKMPGEMDSLKQVLQMMDAAPLPQIDAIVDYCAQRDLRNLEQLDSDLWDMGVTAVNKRRRIINYWARSMGVAVGQALTTKFRTTEESSFDDPALAVSGRGQRRFYVEEDINGSPKVRIARPGESAMSLQEAKEASRELRGQAGKGDEQVVLFSEALGKHIPNSTSDWVKKNMAAAWATAREFDRSAMQNAEPPDPIDTMIDQMTKIEAIKGVMNPGAAGAEGGPKGDLIQVVEAMIKIDEMRKGANNQQQLPAWMTDPVLLISTMKSLSPEKGPDPQVEELKTRLAANEAKMTEMQQAAVQTQFDQLKAQNQALAISITELKNRPAPGEPTALSLMKDGIAVLEKEAKGIRTDLKDLGKDVILTAGQGDPTVAAVKSAVGRADKLEALTDRLVSLTAD
jgi:hypothetical protein